MAQLILLAQDSIKRRQFFAFRFREGAAIGALGELHEGRQMARLGSFSRFLNPADFGRHVREVDVDRRQGLIVRPDFAGFGEVRLAEPLHFRFRYGFGIGRQGEIEPGFEHVPGRLGPLEEDKVLVLPLRHLRYEIKFLPERVEFSLTGVVQHQFVQRAVVAKVALHQVKPGRQ